MPHGKGYGQEPAFRGISNFMTAQAFPRHLIDIGSLTLQDVFSLLSRAREFKAGIQNGTTYLDRLRGKVVLTLFAENSTRTRTSFEMATLRLGGGLVNWDERVSSASKGEAFLDTIRNLSAISPDAIVIRHSEHGTPHLVARHVACPVINAGDSWREHPSQALLDAMTIIEAKGRIEGLRIAICGDVSHSRVAGSGIPLFAKMGARLRIVAPPSLQPSAGLPPGIAVFGTMEEGIKDCDVVMMLRLQKERMEKAAIPDDEAFFQQYGLTRARLAIADPAAIVMHPGPINRGVEIADDVADDPERSVILRQARNGVFVRMAILDLLVGTT